MEIGADGTMSSGDGVKILTNVNFENSPHPNLLRQPMINRAV
jgi:hypothetical protein